MIPGAPRLDRDEVPATRPHRGRRTRVLLVRHGVTPFTEQSRLDGRGGADPSLSPTGRAQALRAAEIVTQLLRTGEGRGTAPARLVTSDLARARQTGAVLAEHVGVAPEVDRRFDEQSFGDWDGVSIGEILDGPDAAALATMRVDSGYARPGGETHAERTARVLEAYTEAVAPGGTVVVVCHRKPIMAMLGHVLGLPLEAQWRLAADPGSVNGIDAWSDGTSVVAFTNRT